MFLLLFVVVLFLEAFVGFHNLRHKFVAHNVFLVELHKAYSQKTKKQ